MANEKMNQLTINGETFVVYDEGAVRFDELRELTSDQKALVRLSIGAAALGSGFTGTGDGVGVQAVYQAVTSQEDGGENTLIVELTDGTLSEFKVRNGKQGTPGAPGAPGANGAPGTPGVGIESVTSVKNGDTTNVTIKLTDGRTHEFSVADGVDGGNTNDMSPYNINLTNVSGDAYTPDITFTEAEEIYNSGRPLACIYPEFGFALPVAAYVPNALFMFLLVFDGKTLLIQFSVDNIAFAVETAVLGENSLRINTFNGIEIVTYNGSEPIVINNRDIAYVKSVNGVAPDGSGNIIISTEGGSGSSGSSIATDIPAYVREEAETVARLVNQHQSNDSVVIPFLADAHCGYYADASNDATTLAGQLLNQIGKRVSFDCIVNGGDMANGAWDTTRELSYEQIEDYTELTSEAHKGVPSVWVPGNHDDSPYMATADRVSQKEIFALIGRKNRTAGAVCPNGCNYGYLDFENRKLRIIYLDTDDKRSWGTVAVGSGETAPDYLNAHNVGGEQLRWLAETALDFSGKSNVSNWTIVIVSHVALNITGTITDAVSNVTIAHNTANAATILNAYKTGGSGNITHDSVTIPYDFSNQANRATIICCMHGHNHSFCDEMVGNIVSIGCPNVMNGRERVSSDGNTYAKTAGTANGTSFCIFTIDRENQVIYADCVGVGVDRQFTYSTEAVSYTNWLPVSTDASGNVYNGKGYKENTYLSSGNEGSMSGIFTTGFIPCSIGDVLYCENLGMQTGMDSHRISFYNANKEHLGTVKTTVTAYTGWNYGTDGNIDSIGIRVSGDNSSTAYIRLCGSYIGDDTIITVNQPIV